MTPAEIVSFLTTTTPDLKPRVGTMSKVWSAKGVNVNGRFHYVTFRDSKPTIDDLIDVAHARLVNFAIPRFRILEAMSELKANPSAMDPWVKLVTEARDLFIKTKDETGRSGELGEVLLYMLIEWVLKAPIVACKMYLKTAQQMPVHGTDGIHLGSDGDNIIMYWGESKMHGALPSALDDIVKSIGEFVAVPSKHKNEVRIVRSSLNLDELNDAAKSALKNYFNPYKPESNKLLNCYACFAGFSSQLYEDVKDCSKDECEFEFRKKYDQRLESARNMILQKIKSAGLQNLRFSYFLMPFPSVDHARQAFQDRLWGASK